MHFSMKPIDEVKSIFNCDAAILPESFDNLMYDNYLVYTERIKVNPTISQST